MISKYIPNHVTQDWMLMNNDLLFEDDYKLVIPEGRSIPIEIAYYILDEYGFVEIDEIRDQTWLVNMAYTIKDGHLDYDSEFTTMVDDMLKVDKGNYVSKRMPKINDLPSRNSGREANQPAFKKDRIISRWGRKFARDRAGIILNSKIAFCQVCLRNETKGMQIASCCAIPLHKYCYETICAGVCPNCDRSDGIALQILLRDKVFLTEEEYKRKLKEATDKKNKTKKQHNKKYKKVAKAFKSKDFDAEDFCSFIETRGVTTGDIEEYCKSRKQDKQETEKDKSQKEDHTEEVKGDSQEKSEEESPEEDKKSEEKKSEPKVTKSKKKRKRRRK